jgi:glycosyltransferase involved in cell wall biosynthesis
MKIAVVAPSEIPARRANTVQVMKMTQAIASLGHEVRLAVPTADPARAVEGRQWDDLARHYGLQTRFVVEWLPASPRLRRYDFGLRSVGWARKWKADLLYTRLPQAAAIGSLAGMPSIYETHDIPQGALGPLLFRAFLNGRGKRRLVVITQSLLGDLANKLGVPAEEPFTLVAPDGVDLSRYASLPEKEEARRLISESLRVDLESDAFMAGYTGHLYNGRGIELLLSVAVLLPDMLFLLTGGEPRDLRRLMTQIQQKRLNNVIIAGFIPNAELPLYQAACDALLMPYQRHVAASSGGDIAHYLSPMKLFEYMACERPILSSDLPVLREVLDWNIAILLPPEDAGSWAAALRELCKDTQRSVELGRRARIKANQYTWEGRAQRILEGIPV